MPVPELKIELNCDFLRKIGEHLKFRYVKVLNIRISPGFFLFIQKGHCKSNMFRKFQHHSMQIFFKMANFLFSKN